jgi:hypothetical protein
MQVVPDGMALRRPDTAASCAVPRPAAGRSAPSRFAPLLLPLLALTSVPDPSVSWPLCALLRRRSQRCRRVSVRGHSAAPCCGCRKREGVRCAGGPRCGLSGGGGGRGDAAAQVWVGRVSSFRSEVREYRVRGAGPRGGAMAARMTRAAPWPWAPW